MRQPGGEQHYFGVLVWSPFKGLMGALELTPGVPPNFQCKLPMQDPASVFYSTETLAICGCICYNLIMFPNCLIFRLHQTKGHMCASVGGALVDA